MRSRESLSGAHAVSQVWDKTWRSFDGVAECIPPRQPEVTGWRRSERPRKRGQRAPQRAVYTVIGTVRGPGARSGNGDLMTPADLTSASLDRALSEIRVLRWTVAVLVAVLLATAVFLQVHTFYELHALRAAASAFEIAPGHPPSPVERPRVDAATLVARAETP